MTRKVAQLRNIFVLLLVFITFATFAAFGIFHQAWMLRLAIFAVITNVIYISLLFYMGYLMDQNSYSVSDALGIDAKNALIYGGVGLIQYDENRNITWVSDFLMALNINIVGIKLLEWQPTLASLFDDEDVKTIEVKGKKFEVYNSADTRLIYMKDVTQYLSLSQDYEDMQVCMGYITVDNYDEIIANVDESQKVKIQNLCRSTITDWAYKNGMIIRRYQTGKYIVFFNERIYKKLIESKFSILDDFKNAIEELDVLMTLSIGIGRSTKVLRELEELASSALSLAYSRGGDQIAIKSGKDHVRYFGGKTDAFETSSKVRSRIMAQSLAGLISRSRNVLVMGHKNSDLDSFGASLAAARIAENLGKKANIVIDYESLEEKTKGVVEMLRSNPDYKGLMLTISEALEKTNKDTLLICVDNHKDSLAISRSVLDKVKNKVIIDHHRRSEEFISSPVLTYLEPSASSTVELLVELFDYQQHEIEISSLDATVMYTGMLVDTNYFRQHVGTRTFQSAAKLKEAQADLALAYELLEDSFECMKEIFDITESAYRYKDRFLIATGKDDELSRSTLAKAANQLVYVSGIYAAFAIGYISKNTVAISARSSKKINVQMIMEDLNGGGHFSMAACQIENVTIEEAKERLEHAIDAYLEDRGV